MNIIGRAKPLLLDLFCGAGGAAMGYRRAGFEVVGVDIAPQKNYPFKFIQADAFEYGAVHGHEYDAIHASPPCQSHSKLKRLAQFSYADLIPATRCLLDMLAVPYVIENVEDAPLLNPALLCGSHFGLKVYRHRIFESSILLFQPVHMPHDVRVPSAGRGVSPKGFISVSGTGGVVKGGLPADWTQGAKAYMQMAMGIDWTTRAELSQTIPPAFTEYIGRQLIAAVTGRIAQSWIMCPLCEQPMLDLGFDHEQGQSYWYCEPCEVYEGAA